MPTKRCMLTVALALAMATACTSQSDRSVPSPTEPSGGPAALSTRSLEPLRRCAGLVGGPTSAAIIGMQVTCSFGGRDTRSRLVSVRAMTCPDGAPFYVFLSTAADATDNAVYYGSEASPLFRTNEAAADLATERRQACT